MNRRPVHTVDDLARIITSGDDVLSLVVIDPQVGQMIINYSLRP